VNSSLYEAASYIMRYWFVILVVLMLFGVILISIREYREKKYVMGMAGKYIGFIEILAGSPEYMHERYGLLNRNTIGRSKRADVCIPDSSLKRVHALLYFKNGAAYINTLGTGEVLRNGHSVDKPRILNTGDVLTLGGVIIGVHLKEGER